MKRQSQAFADHLEEALLQKEKEIDRNLARMFDEKLEEEKCRFKMQLAAMIGRLRGLDRTMKSKLEFIPISLKPDFFTSEAIEFDNKVFGYHLLQYFVTKPQMENQVHFICSLHVNCFKS